MKKKSSSGRPLCVRLKSTRGLTLSSRRWLTRQLNDPYVQKAKAAGYRSRASYKLIEIDDKFKILKPGLHVVDLGAAPGGWTQVAVERVAQEVLERGGVFVAKVLRGGTEKELLTLLKRHFEKVTHFKPPSSRADSAEIYVVAIGFRP
ncbi:MAG: RlmE family RNA methyltransferase [Proteobacteria bacterium]|nr:RlmE family RNA methyltransferase [Pseudomonadota bacterium]